MEGGFYILVSDNLRVGCLTPLGVSIIMRVIAFLHVRMSTCVYMCEHVCE